MVRDVLKYLIIPITIVLLVSCAVEIQDFPVASITVEVASTCTEQGSVTGSGTYLIGATVTIKATPNPGYRFVRWNDGNTNAKRVITVPSTGGTYTACFGLDSPLTIFTEDFESGSWYSNTTTYAGPWDTATYQHYPWDRTSSITLSGTYGIGAQGTRTTYPDNTISELRRVLDLPNVTSATLNFYEYINTETFYDDLKIWIIVNETDTCNLLYTNSGSSGWMYRTVDLSSYVGKIITLVFQFNSDYTVVPSGIAGVWLDDISVTVQ